MIDNMVEFYFWFNLILVSLAGLCVGSFLNVVIYRIPLSFFHDDEAISIAFPPSHCPVCKHRIAVRDNIPLISYLLLNGRCRYCQAKISIFYPLTEAITLFSFICIYFFVFDKGMVLFLLTSFLFCMLYVVSITDIKFYIIPDRLLLFLFLGGVIYSCLYGNVIHDIFGLVIFTLIFSIIVFACDSFSDKQMLGMGDIKLYLSVVLWTGSLNFPFVMLTSSVTGLCLVAVWRFYVRKCYVPNELTRDIDETTYIPFAPAIAVGVFIVYLFVL
ncbi:prepilin peptidase [Salmonella enterica]|nr:prepilin peptidase [Salmonella enterica subsp. enterica serovar Stanley]EGS9941582.1 prepilin peptidase [Salmonella enterica]